MVDADGVTGALLEEAASGPSLHAFGGFALGQLDCLVGLDSALFLRGTESAGALNKPTDHAAILGHYRRSFSRYRPELARGEAIALREGAYLDSEVYSAHERGRLAFFQEILQPQGITSRIMAYARFRGRVIATIHLCRHDRLRAFEREHVDQIRRVLPAITLAFAALRPPPAALRPSPAAPEPSPTTLRPSPAAPEPSPTTLSARLDALTARERQIVDAVRLGYRNKEIAAMLGTSPYTVRNQLARIFEGLGISTRAELAAWVERAEL